MSKRRRRVPAAAPAPGAAERPPTVEFLIVSTCRHIQRLRDVEPPPRPEWCDLCRRPVDLKSSPTVVDRQKGRILAK